MSYLLDLGNSLRIGTKSGLLIIKIQVPRTEELLRSDGLVNEWGLVLVCSVVQLCPTLVTPWMVAYQAPLSVEFSKEEYWSRLPFHTPGDLPNPGIEPVSPAFPALAGGFFTTEPGSKQHKSQN